ncbi:hypothetical protein Dsin_021794 [Dipteronia sinensis]|uniref:DUF4283 domain-containing protein n=1 Tax=Dipteronia sinensis TaxID=43782 RepID=A0AAE0A0E5_9ROSI|nr:hypothetical protein Dsin_021794 [Dipteronia sinensis]
MEDQPLSLPHKSPSAGVISILKSSFPIKCNIESSKGVHLFSFPKLDSNKAPILGGAGPCSLNTTDFAVTLGDLPRTPRTSSSAVIGNNGVFEGPYLVTPPKNVIGKRKGSTDQDDMGGKPNHGAPRLNQPFSTNGNVEKPPSKGEACPSTNVQGQLEDTPSLSNSKLHHKKGTSITPFLVNIDPNNTGNRGMVEVLANDKGFYFFKFADNEACSNVLESGPWLFAGRMVILKKWHPKLILTKGTHSKILVWVKLFNIPHEYWTEEGLSHIASAVGEPLYAHSLTKSMKRISFARICIEINASCDLVDSFDLFMGGNSDPNHDESVEILVEYQWKQKICSECKSFGHYIATCPRLKPLHPPSDTDFAPKPKQEWRRVNRRDNPLVSSPQVNLEPFLPLTTLKVDEVIPTCSSEIEPSSCPAILAIHNKSNDLTMESVIDTSNKFSALDEDGDYCNDDDSPSTASPDQSIWHLKIKNIDGATIIDHCPSVVKLGLQGIKKNRLFKIFNFLMDRAYFLPLVERCWREQVYGTMQYKLCSKLRNLTNVLNTLNNDKVGDLTIKLIEAKAVLDDCQRLLDLQPFDSNLRIREQKLISCYSSTLKAKEDLLSRSIGDNILLAQELMRNYHKDVGCPKLALKVDLIKAFDMVDWGFLLETLAAFHFPHKVITWIKACLTTLKFSISFNGELANFFSGKRGLS